MLKINSNQILASKWCDEKVYIDIAKSIAEHGTRLLWGQGYEYTDKNEQRKKAVMEMFALNKAANLFRTITNLMSLYGRCLVIIDFINGKPRLHTADMSYNSKVGRAWADDTGAVFWYRPIQDDLNHMVKVVSTPKYNKYTAYANGEEIAIDELNEKLPKENQIPERWDHNLGFVPVVQMLNKDYYVREIAEYEYLQMADCYNVRDMLDAINTQINELVEEAQMTHTRAYGSFGVETLKKMKQTNTSANEFIMRRLFIDQGIADSNKGITIQQSNFDGPTRWEVIDKMLNRVMYEAGYSPIEDQTQQTATEVLYSKARDIETTKQKRNRMQLYISELIKKCMVIMGYYSKEQYQESIIFGDDTWAFEIKENMILSPVALSEQLYQMYERDQISYVEMIAKLRDISVEEAETIAEEILKKNNEIKAEQLATMANVSGNEEGENNNEAKFNETAQDDKQPPEE